MFTGGIPLYICEIQNAGFDFFLLRPTAKHAIIQKTS